MISYIVEEVREGVYRADYPGPEHTKGPMWMYTVTTQQLYGK
jgi:hypothetical protein